MAVNFNTNNVNPRVLVLGVDKDPKDLVLQIVDSEATTCTEQGLEIKEYLWKIKNKYYSANVCITTVNYEISQQLDQVEAVAMYIDTKHSQILTNLKKVNEYLTNYDVETKIVIADNSSPEIQDWCMDNEYEFIDLSKTTGDEDDYFDTFGIERVKEVLQVHIWSNAQVNSHSNMEDKSENQVELELDEFSALFSQFNSIKESIHSLSRDQRLDCAEQVLNKFWNAIGGDEDELDEASSVDEITPAK